MRQAVSHLAELGHARIGLAVGPARYVPVVRKVEGFLAAHVANPALDAKGAETRIAHTMFSVAGGQQAARVLVERGCTAIVCASDMMALGVIRALREEELSVPGDVSVIGYDASPLIAFTDPPLTTMRPTRAGDRGGCGERAAGGDGGDRRAQGRVRLRPGAGSARLDRRRPKVTVAVEVGVGLKVGLGGVAA
jgi:hypothetical protein